ncbi:MAG: efflux transporter outer membrane subunit, partial [Novosphingobium sp.]
MPISHPPLSGRLVALSPLLMVAACASVPDTGPPAVPRTATEVAAARSLTTTAAAQWPEANAWQTQADPQLAALIAEGLAHSPDLAAAQARIRQATGMAQAAGAPLLPSAEIQGALTVDKLSYNTGFPKAFVPHGWLDNGQLAGALQWDIDLWGRNRAGLAAARSEQRAAEIDAQQSRLLLSTAIALAYSDLARLFEEQDIRTAALALRQSSERLVGQRERGGMDTRGSLRLAEAQTATARAELSATQEALALRRHQIAALVGAGPDRGLDITRPQWREPVLNGLPVDVTTELLARRPDVAMARERIEAAASRVKVARADFYPAIRLSALYGVQALGIDMLFEKDST